MEHTFHSTIKVVTFLSLPKLEILICKMNSTVFFYFIVACTINNFQKCFPAEMCYYTQWSAKTGNLWIYWCSTSK